MRLKQRSTAGKQTVTARRERRARCLWIAADVLAVTVIGGSLWWRWLNVVPTVSIPALPPLPRPNAFDTFCKAGGLMTDKSVIDEVHYGIYALPKQRNGIPYSDSETAAAVAHNAPALVMLRSGLSEKYRFPSRRSFSRSFPECTVFRDLVYLLDVEGKVREASGDFGSAAESQLDAMQLGVMVPRGGDLFANLMGNFYESVGRRSLWSLTNKLSGPEARAAARRLGAINAQRVSMADIQTEEKWSVETKLLQEFQTETILPLCLRTFSFRGREAGPQVLARYAPLLKTSKTQTIQNYDAYMNGVIARSRLPYQSGSATDPPPVSADRMNAVLSPFARDAPLREVATRMQDNLLLAVLALRAYQAEHGSFPEDLLALVRGGYLTSVPTDPFNPTGDAPLSYRRREDGTYLLYSVGPDGKDDGGTPMVEGNNRQIGIFMKPGTKGDFVVGISNS